jgi:aminopeptidase N
MKHAASPCRLALSRNSVLVALLSATFGLVGAACTGSQQVRSDEHAVVQASATEVLLASGISQALAEHRARTLSDPEYDLELDVTSLKEVFGKVHIAFKRSANAGDLILDFRGRLRGAPVVNGQIVNEYRIEHNHLVIPARYLTEGRNEVASSFIAAIGKAGAAIIHYHDNTDDSDYLYTVLVPANAQALFPTFDQPSLKARVRLTVTAPQGWTVLGNAELLGKQPVENGERWFYAQTPPIPTYVMSFAAGPWHEWESKPPGQRPMKLYARPSIADAVDAEEFINLNRRTIDTLEQLLGTPYPYGKYDMLIAPAFPLGAMEHVASVYYGEAGSLFLEPPSVSQMLARTHVAYHEIAHQWFGNLVTMTWFDDLWLKEGFSTYMSARLQERLDPASEAWKTFYIRLKPAAYVTEQTSATMPLWQPLGNLADAGGNYGTIVYNKAPSILRQLSFLIGEECFTEGLERFIKKYSFGNATWQDLMRTMEEVSGRSLEQFGKQYFLRPGMAEVSVHLDQADGRIEKLTLRQSPSGKLAGKSNDVWPMRVQVRLGYSDREDLVIPVMFESAQVEVRDVAGLPVPDYVWANDGDYGYGRFLLDERSREWAIENVSSLKDGLLRAQLWGTIWDDVRDARVAPQDFVEMVVRKLGAEQDEQVARFVLTMASTAVNRYLRPTDAPNARRKWEDLLLARSADASLTFGARKDSLDALIGSVTSREGIGAIEDYLDGRRLFDGKPLAQVTRWNMITRLLALDAPGSQARSEQERARDQGAQAARLAFIAGAAVNDRQRKDQLFESYVSDASINESWAMNSFGMFITPAMSDEEAVRYLAQALERLIWIRDNRSVGFLFTWIRGFVSNQRTREALQVVDAYLARHPNLAQAVRTQLLEARDELERTVRILQAQRH